MIATTIFPGRYVQGYNATERLGEELIRLGDSAFLVGDPFALDEIVPKLRRGVEEELTSHCERFGGESSGEEVARLAELARGLEVKGKRTPSPGGFLEQRADYDAARVRRRHHEERPTTFHGQHAREGERNQTARWF